MRICDPRVGIVRDGHEPNEAEKQRPCCMPIKPVHVISSPTTGESRRFSKPRSLVRNFPRQFAVARRRVPAGATDYLARISPLIMSPPCTQAPVETQAPGLFPPCFGQLVCRRRRIM